MSQHHTPQHLRERTDRSHLRADAGDAAGAMSHRQIMEALSGLLLAMFVAMLSSTVVTNALPRIVADLEGSQTGYTWVVVATLLAMTATTPVWGKLADLFSKKLLVQTALVVYTVGSVLASVSHSMGMLIGARLVQGLGVGGLTALVQVVIATMVPPRERGRYSGYIGAVFALATVSGPLIGGVIVDSSFGWRGCFYVGLPFAVLAFVLLQKTLHLPVVTRPAKVDVLGATLIMAGVSILLIWVSLAGNQFAWASATTAALVVAGLLVLALAVWVETRAVEPIIPLHLFRDRTIALATTASVFVGVAMFGATVYLSQYFQTARGMTPTHAGLMSIAMVGGLLVSSIGTGRIITATGRWKRFLVGGMVLVVVGLGLLGTIDETTNLAVVGAFMAVLGIGLGATMQNLVLAVQNNVPVSELGAASSVVAFFRSLGGSIGVAVLGALLSNRVATRAADGLTAIGVTPDSHQSHEIPDLATLPAPVRGVFEAAFGQSFGELFLVAAPFALVALVCVSLIREVPLRTTNDLVEVADELLADAAPEATAELTATIPSR
ncbi:MDR family MFS transporter [Nocardioides fonticola]|uniref:MDR family MFS transporter n=1 Tax=Nocardioides fonticola TaxID=450363 RepID=A0ABP7XJ46_9ACTN